ncbi:MAG: hypothetical protein JXR96_28035 [Deltaproteobacteria bacterium]|nr:hypothetical protein [Deltaproteobacteria bacterium]
MKAFAERCVSSRWSQCAIVLVVIACAAWQVWGRRPLHPVRPVRELPPRQLELEPAARLALVGSTPCMSWSPDSRRLVINSAFEAWTGERQNPREGIYVLDARTGRAFQVAQKKAYHPFWLDRQTVGWVKTYFAGEPAGIFLAPARRDAQLRQVPRIQNAHRGHLARNGMILACLDDDNGYGWFYVDPRSGRAQNAKIPESKDSRAPSWQMPREFISDQCPDRVGGLAAYADAEHLLLSYGPGEVYVLAGVKPFQFGNAYGDDNPAIQPCLSPDGRQLAYLAATGRSGFELRVVRVPGRSQARMSARQVAVATQPQTALRAQVRLALHGSTPSMSWSPDSSRIVVNSAYEYYGHDDRIRQLADKLGIYVLDSRSGRSLQVFRGQGYHPFWFSTSAVGWCHSEYEDGKPGLYEAPVQHLARARRIGAWKGVHRSLLAKDGNVLAYVGFPEDKGWSRIERRSGGLVKLPELGGVSSWDDPAGFYRDQCLQRAGSAALEARGSDALALVRTGVSYALGERPLFQFRGDYGRGSGQAVRACLSPDGRNVAYLVSGEHTEIELHIARVP